MTTTGAKVPTASTSSLEDAPRRPATLLHNKIWFCAWLEARPLARATHRDASSIVSERHLSNRNPTPPRTDLAQIPPVALTYKARPVNGHHRSLAADTNIHNGPISLAYVNRLQGFSRYPNHLS